MRSRGTVITDKGDSAMQYAYLLSNALLTVGSAGGIDKGGVACVVINCGFNHFFAKA